MGILAFVLEQKNRVERANKIRAWSTNQGSWCNHPVRGNDSGAEKLRMKRGEFKAVGYIQRLTEF